jgi:hypothetical protein
MLHHDSSSSSSFSKTDNTYTHTHSRYHAHAHALMPYFCRKAHALFSQCVARKTKSLPKKTEKKGKTERMEVV